MRKTALSAALLSVFVAAPAFAEEASPIAANFTITNNYFFRGITQTEDKPAIQGGFDYVHDSGFYVGTWGSNVSWLDDSGKSSVKLDVYGGYRFEAGPLAFDVGALQYTYPGSKVDGVTKADTLELYASSGWKWFTAKISYSATDLFGVDDSKGSLYPELGASVELGAGFTAVAHVGRQIIKNNDGDYNDFKLGVTKDYAGLNFGAFVIDTDITKPRALVTVSKSF
ncbi:MAG: hypothetical protein CGU28_06645 [Candidatus Dactylopiibacterium carminicum]|uniref:Outer membrane protein beta-barrel domain-containing protein n=1 Tax=Candidatus Dactylopiibacterium carminicum TaxID=857335 RepID=A0A272EYE1_9RHOO|nr:TorF family putative porin [Candidatus Dactylopiibacterium carminicum]KAF7600306.1 hypothetical protein BGI27_03580 [Candidatus Dactylopiibacterium carminicum]PAS94640.1 MAG: hypothetical protein CGU29_02735 [Candidatus Dactylopiibacterium carminicum]PAS96929.1 MAG: hypothetical protein CGU28_06645 [Candidatus Dactylopiibacterium carminicum]PAT00308.1 MAG: hypothetical protein BSR46_03605 [Candidatus Dactylopiibacterium carminicum]